MGECVLQRLTQPWLADEVVYSLSANARREKFIVKKLHNFTKQIVEKRREKRMLNSKNAVEGNVYEKKIKPALLDLLLDEEEQGNIDNDGVLEEVDTFLFEGHDTTASALTFMVMRIANEPVAQTVYTKN
uniref:SFRICE020009.2 n=1 Tax=Spodoptera frugiperda TaxID=7108 RepID=A0A2H1V361_SPOFR